MTSKVDGLSEFRDIISVIALVVVGTPAFGVGLSNEYKKCVKATDTNAGWEECSDQEIKRQEARLIDAWKKAYGLMKEFSEDGAQMLLEEHKAWVKFKDAACTYFSSGDFGREGEVIFFGDCKARIIANRVETLKELASNIQGGEPAIATPSAAARIPRSKRKR